MKYRSASRISCGVWPDSTRISSDTIPFTINASLSAVKRITPPWEESEEVSVETVEDFLLNGLGLEDSSLILDSFINKVVLYEDNAALTMMFTGEKGEPAEFSLMGGEFALIESGRPHLSVEEPDAYLIKGGIAVIIPVSRSSSPS
jgi:hypothetical protein